MEGVGTQLQGVGESWEPCARRQHYRTKQNQQFIPSFHLVLTIPRTGQQGPIVAVVIWGQNHYCSECPPLPSLSMLAVLPHGLGYFWGCVPAPHKFLCTPQRSRIGLSSVPALLSHTIPHSPCSHKSQPWAVPHPRTASLDPEMLEHVLHTPTLQPLWKSEFNKHIQPVPGCPWP